MSGPCAKRAVFCTIHARGGGIVTGSNSCENPQLACPREVGEGYEKCKTVCQQGAHAEVDAVRRARRQGFDLRGSTAFIGGHYWCCEACGRALAEAGVHSITIYPTL